MPNDRSEPPSSTRLLSCYLDPAADDGLAVPALMLCEMLGDEIQSISLRVAAEGMARGSVNAHNMLRPD